MMNKSYSELSRFETFDDRFDYLKLEGIVGQSTFGFDRHINQGFYMSSQWKNIRDAVIVRDNGCDLGILGHEINVELLVHHMNPIVLDDIVHGEEWVLDPEYLITTSKRTHNAIHFGFAIRHPKIVVTRSINDTKLW